jgi:hypothetical protein
MGPYNTPSVFLKNTPALFSFQTIETKNLFGVTGVCLAGCSKRPSSKAAGKSKPEAYPLGYVEDFDELRTPLADFFSILLLDFSRVNLPDSFCRNVERSQ